MSVIPYVRLVIIDCCMQMIQGYKIYPLVNNTLHLLVIAFVRLNRTSLDWVWWSLEWFLVARHVGIWTGQVTTPIFLVFRVQIESNNDIYTVLNSIFRGDSPPLSLQHCFLNDTLNIDSIYLSSIYMISLSSPLFIF